MANTRNTTAEPSAATPRLTRGHGAQSSSTLGWRTWAALAAAPAALVLAHIVYGANQRTASLILAAGEAALLVAWLTFGRSGRAALSNPARLWIPAACLMLTLLAAAWSLTPWAIGGALPVWAWIEGAGAATLDRGATLIEMIKLAGLGCLALVGFIQGSRSRHARATLRIILVLGAVYAFLGLVRFLAGGEHVGQAHRLGAGFLSPNSAGTLFAAMVVLGVCAVVGPLRARADPSLSSAARLTQISANLALLLLFSGCLLLTASRAAITVAGAALVVFVAWEMLSGGLKLRSGAMMLTGWGAHLMVLLAGVGAVAMTRMGGLGDDVAVRQAILGLHWQMFVVSPMTGWGLGTFDAINQQIITPSSYYVLWDLRAAHNVFLQWLEEVGLVGAIPMFAAVGSMIVLTLAGFRSTGRDRSWVRALLLVDAVFIAHGLTDFALQVPSLSGFWAFLLGLQLAMTDSSTAR